MLRVDRTGWLKSILVVLLFINSSSPLESLSAIGSEPDLNVFDPLVAVNQHDATLRSVCAISANYVVAVGDRGLILTTDDGGKNWKHQNSGTTANLHGVEFFDAQRGWAVGGAILPQSKSSIGVVLATTDGGATWSIQSAGVLPRLTGIAAVGRSRLVAFGDYASQLKSSVFESLDGGASWRGISLPIGHAQAVGWSNSGVGVAFDRSGNACVVPSTTRSESIPVFEPSRPAHSLLHTGNHWLACGAGGQVQSSPDGQAWHDVPLPIGQSARRVCHWYSVAQSGNSVWIAGYPGSVVFRSSDGGMTFEKLNDRHSLPKFGLAFADSARGWAVGPGGSILATHDAGATWFVQRSVWQRLAVQSLASRVDNVPWSALASVGWDDCRSTGGLVVHVESSVESSSFLPEPSAIAEELASHIAMADLRILRGFPSAKGTANDTQLIDALVTAIEVWQPDTVITDDPGDKRQLERTVSQTVMRAVRLAAAPDAERSRLARELNLDAWRVKKIVATAEKPQASYSVSRNQVLREAGLSLGDVLLPLGDNPSTDSSELHLRTLEDDATTPAAKSSLLGGIAPTAETHRKLALKNIGKYQFVMARAHREAAIQRLLQTNDLEQNSARVWRGQLEFLTKSCPKREVGQSLMRIARGCLNQQQWSRCEIALQLLVETAPNIDATRWAQIELLKLTASDEMYAWRRRQNSTLPTSQDAELVRSLPGTLSTGRANWSETPFESHVVPASASQAPLDSQPVQPARFDALDLPSSTLSTTREGYISDLRKSLDRFRSIASLDPFLISRPDFLLLQQSRLRRYFETADAPAALPTNVQDLALQTQLAGWNQVAEQELRLMSGKLDELKLVAFAARTKLPPHLDGKLDEEFWQRANAIELTDSLGLKPAMPSTIRWAFDDRYLYFAAMCLRKGTGPATRTRPTRQYDMNLTESDHLHVVLDTDRDYATVHELGINVRGETFDRTCGFASWNPKWYVAVEESGQTWTAEAAIALEDLTVMDNIGGRAWAMSVHRTIPDVGVQTWSYLPCAKPALHASGLLLLQP